MVGTGVTAPAFTLEDLQGGEKSLDRILSKGPALVALFKSSCPVSQYTFPFLERIAKGGTLQFIAISQDDRPTTEKFRKQFGITFPTLLDKESDGYRVSNALGITHVPSLFLIEANGVISLAGAGFSKKDIEEVGRRAGVQPFRPGEKVPEFQAG